VVTDESYWTISVRWGQAVYRDAPEHILEALAGRYATYNAAHHAAQIVTAWARLPLGRAKIAYQPAGARGPQEDEDYWTISVRWGKAVYRDAPEHILEALAGRYATYNRAYQAAQLVTQWARIPFERAKISQHGPASKR
jgi:hypothetical protein